jgi:hypothetical protein
MLRSAETKLEENEVGPTACSSWFLIRKKD